MQALALMDAALSPGWDLRRFSFDATWGAGQSIRSMRDGSGTELFALFSPHGCYIKGFDHEAPLDPAARDALHRAVPEGLRAALAEPAFSPDDVTLCGWQPAGESIWHGGGRAETAVDGFLAALHGTAEDYQAFAAEYFEVTLDLADISSVLAHVPLDGMLARRFAPGSDPAATREEAASIGYPVRP